MAAALKARNLGLFRHTPLINSIPLSQLLGVPVSLKLDNLQVRTQLSMNKKFPNVIFPIFLYLHVFYKPSGSFKDRGISHYALKLRDGGAKKLISSSGGNAGLACTAAGVTLGLEVEVIVPETTGQIIKSKIQSLV